jgi:hypothetical protein
MNGFASSKRMRTSITIALTKTTRKVAGFEVDPDFLSLKLNLKVYAHCTSRGIKLPKCLLPLPCCDFGVILEKLNKLLPIVKKIFFLLKQ